MNPYLTSLILFLVFIFGISLISSEINATLAPQVYFTELKLEKNSFEPGEEIRGSVSLWNYEDFVISDLVFYFQLLGEEIDGVATQMIDEKIDREIFSLSAGEKATKSFSYLLPSNLPQGDFKFRIQLANRKGEEMSWIDKVITIGGEGKVLTLDNYWILKDGQNLSPGAGVYYQPEEIAEVVFDVINDSKFTITAFPKIITYKRNVSGTIINTQEEKGIILKPAEKRTLKISLPRLEKPESYLSEVRFYDSDSLEPISNSIYFRWIISGPDAEILFSNLNKDSYEEGEEAEVQIQFTGPADFRVEGGEGEIKVYLFDEKGKLVGQKEKKIELKSGQIIVKVPLEERVDNPKVLTEIIKEGNILDQYEFQIKPVKIPKEIKRVSFFEKNKKLIIAFLIILIMGAIIYYFLKIKKIKLAKTLILLTLIGGGILFGNYILAGTEVTGGCCDTTIVFNSPLPNAKYTVGDTINFSGKFKVTGCGNGLFFNKITFYITENRDIPITDCCGHTSDDCGFATTCGCKLGCIDCYGAKSSRYSSCDFKWCDEVKYLDTTKGYKIYKLGTIYPSDVAGGAKPYWVEYNQNFVIPENLGFSGPVRFYVQYSGTHWSTHWHWNITYQPGYINSPPTAAISCDPPNCQQYYGSPLILVNASTDPDGDGDIVVSKWYKKLQGEPDTSYELLSYCDCTYKCDCTPQAEVTPGSYTAKLYIEDSVGQPSTATENFQIFKDAEAGFMCSLDNRNWRSCEEIKPSGGELVYFRDDPALPEYSTFSQGATSINQRIWRLNSQVFDSDNNPNPSLALNQTSNIIELTITDNQGRTDFVSHTISTGIPLPDWKEIPPF